MAVGPTSSDVHQDAALSSIAIAYRPQNMIADLVAQQVPVTKQSDKFYIWDFAYWMRNQVEVRAPGDTYPAGLMKLSNSNYFAELKHLAKLVNDEDVVNEDDAIQQMAAAAEWLADQFAIDREITVEAAIFNASIWDSDITTPTNKWTDATNGVPIDDIDTSLDQVEDNTGYRPNTLVINRKGWTALRKHPDITDLFKHTRPGTLTRELVAGMFDLDNLHVGRGVQVTSAPEATTTVTAPIWDDHMLSLWVPPSPGIRVAAGAYTFAWNAAGGPFSGTIPVETRRDDSRDAEEVRAKHGYDVKVVGSNLGAWTVDVVT